MVLAAGIGAAVFAEHMAGRDPLRCKERGHPTQAAGNSPRTASGTVEAVYQAPDCSIPKTDKEDDLCQQRRMAHAAEESACIARWQYWVSLFGLGGLLGTIVYSARSARAAAEAAEAATQSSIALVSTERANLRIIIKSQNIEQSIRWILSDPTLNLGAGAGLSINYAFKNYGRTPAFIKEITGEIVRSGEGLPPRPRYAPSGLYAPFEGALAADESTNGISAGQDALLTADDVKAVDEGHRSIWFYGRVVYDDVFRTQHEYRFLYRCIGPWNFFGPHHDKEYEQYTQNS